MAWEWSHSGEAYEAAEYNLRKQPRKWLEVCQAENVADAAEKASEELSGSSDHIWHDAYERELRRLRSRKHPVYEDDIADAIWEFACEYRTCDNGGGNAWMCSTGCHTVSFTAKALDNANKPKA